MRSPGRSNPTLTLIGIALIVGAWLYYQHDKTGRWSLLPVNLSPSEQELFRLEKRMESIDKKLAELGRISMMAGEKNFHSKEQQELQQEREDLVIKIRRQKDKMAKEAEQGGTARP